MNNLFVLFLYFFIYSVLGWCTETIYCRLCEGKWSDRGFLYGPYCPIYGFGGIIVVLLSPFSYSPILIFLLAFLLTSILEYVTSYVMEKLFDAKWWDYSHMPFNINGRVCLLNSCLFGILGLFLTYLIHPHIQNLVSKIPTSFLPYILFVIFILLTIDLVVTLNAVLNLKSRLKFLQELKEKIQAKTEAQNTELTKQLEELKLDFMNKRENLRNRLINAFPNMDVPKFGDSFTELKIAIHNYHFNKKQQRKNKKKEK